MSPIKQLLIQTLLAALASGGTLAAEPKTTPPNNSILDAGLFYELLVGELSAQSGDNTTASGLMLNAARRANSSTVYERAVELALRERNGQAALDAAQNWSRAFPASLEANRYVLQILIGLNRIAETQEPIRRTLARMPAAERPAFISQLPLYFSRTPEKKLASKVVENALVPDMARSNTSSAAWSTIGVMRLQASDAKGALEAAQNGVAANPKAKEPVVLAIALIGPKLPAAETIVQKYLAAKPLPEVRMAYARKLIVTQREAEASVQMRLLTEEKPDSPEAWWLRGGLELGERKLPEAEASLKTYVALAAKTVDPAKNGAMERNLVQAYVLLAQIAEQGQRLDEALSYLAQIDSATDAMAIETRKALILARQGKMEDARALIRKVPELQADDGRNKINTEVTLLREYKQYQAAYDVLTNALVRYPQDLDFLYEQAMLAERMGDTDNMERLLRQVIAINPEHYHAINALGYSLAVRGIRLPEARQLINKALGFLPNEPDLVDSLAWVEFRSGNGAEALRLLQQAFKARPNAEIAAHLGEVLWTAGQRDEANAIWKEGIKLNAKNDTLIETMQRLRDKP